MTSFQIDGDYSRKSRRERFFRFNDQHSGILSLSPDNNSSSQNNNNNRNNCSQTTTHFASFLSNLFPPSFLRRRSKPRHHHHPHPHPHPQQPTKCDGVATIFDPRAPLLQHWNKIFLVSCIVAAAVDPLFFYIPVMDESRNCIDLDNRLKLAACLLRTATDLFYLTHIVLQFRTGFVDSDPRGLGRGVLVKDPVAIAKRYLSRNFWVDAAAIAPLPQMAILFIIPRMSNPVPLATINTIKILVFAQYVPRLARIGPLYTEVTRNSGVVAETPWAGAAYNLFIYFVASHIVGALWYFLAIEVQYKCWRSACDKTGNCDFRTMYCSRIGSGGGGGGVVVGRSSISGSGGGTEKNTTYDILMQTCAVKDPDSLTSSDQFNYGIYYDALFNVLTRSNFPEKLLYCFWWGLRNLSSYGQNLQTATRAEDNLFSIFISVLGLVLFALLIGNVQKYLQSTGVRVEEMRVRRQDTEQWMSHRMLPTSLKQTVRRYEQFKWQVTRGVDEQALVNTFPKDLRRDVKRHICLSLLDRVPMLSKMDERLKDAMCYLLKPVLYTKDRPIIREGDPVSDMFFVTRGRLTTSTTNGGRTGFLNSGYLDEGDFFGEELLTWALNPGSSLSSLPISTRTVKSVTEVEAFALSPEDIKFVASQYRRLNSKMVRSAFRFHSQQWRTWAACFVQAAWRQYRKRKLERSLRAEEEELEEAVVRETRQVVPAARLGGVIYASRFSTNVMRNLRTRDALSRARSVPLPSLQSLRKPDEPDFGPEDD